MQKLHLTIAYVILNFASCKIADIHNSNKINTEKSPIVLIDNVIEKQNFKYLEFHRYYRIKGQDHWPGLTGSLTKLWPQKDGELVLNCAFNTFDGFAQFPDKKNNLHTTGVQTWNFYTVENQEIIKIPPKGSVKKEIFGLHALQYFTELAYRLKNASFHNYYGTQMVNDITYDLVFVSWKGESPHKDLDQYIIWINQKTSLIDYCQYTIRENKNPLTRKFHGSIKFEYSQNSETTNTFIHPRSFSIYINNNAFDPKSKKKFLHQYNVESFEVKVISEEALYPFQNIPKIKDSKN